MVVAKKNFFAKWPEKHLEKIRIEKKLWIFSKCFSGHFSKKFFLLEMIFGPSWWVLAKKKFLKIFILKKHAKWYQGKIFSGIFLASVCPLEYKDGQFLTCHFFRPHGSISSTVIHKWENYKAPVTEWKLLYI